jgi:ATP-dependent Clp protease ATP-binding subunit ClpA
MTTKNPGSQRQEIDWLTPLTRAILSLAQQEAVQTGIAYIQAEHLLLGVIVQGESEAATLLNTSGLDAATLRAHTKEVYGEKILSKEASPPLSQQAEECIEYAIAMIAYYLTRQPPLARVAPEHLVLSVISHPGVKKLLVTHPVKIASLRHQLTKNMDPNFLRHVEDLFLLPDHMRDTTSRKAINLAVRSKEQARKILSAANLRCPSCSQQIQSHWKHCTYCGTNLTMRCDRCGAPSPNVKGAKFCVECGNNLT